MLPPKVTPSASSKLKRPTFHSSRTSLAGDTSNSSSPVSTGAKTTRAGESREKMEKFPPGTVEKIGNIRGMGNGGGCAETVLHSKELLKLREESGLMVNLPSQGCWWKHPQMLGSVKGIK